MDETDVVIVAVGNVSRRKGQEYGLRALARVAATIPETGLLLVGRLDRDPTYAKRMGELVTTMSRDCSPARTSSCTRRSRTPTQGP